MNDNLTVIQKVFQQGQIRQLMCSPWEGVMLWMNDVQTDFLPVAAADYSGLWINYCIDGSCELLIENEGFFYLEAGQLCVGPNKAMDKFRYPTGRYLGLELFIRETSISNEFGQLMEDIGFIRKSIGKNVVGIPAEKLHRHLAVLSDHLMRADGTLEDYRMNTLILLYLIGKGEISVKEKDFFLNKRQRMLALEAASELKERLAENVTIRELADQYGVSISSLKSILKLRWELILQCIDRSYAVKRLLYY